MRTSENRSRRAVSTGRTRAVRRPDDTGPEEGAADGSRPQRRDIRLLTVIASRDVVYEPVRSIG